MGLQVAVYPVIAEPPLKVGGVKEIIACPGLGVATPIVGAPGTVAMMLKLRSTLGAGLKLALPGWLARTVQAPTSIRVTRLPLTLQTAVVVEMKVTAKPEAAAALRLNGASPKFLSEIAAKLML